MKANSMSMMEQGGGGLFPPASSARLASLE